ncbi:MAG: ABC transporter permease [Tabrizicola sp.]|nr:ABC transporter permease [Tabrizicola sp.]
MTTPEAPTKTISDFEATLSGADAAVVSFAKDDKSFVHVMRGYLRSYPTLIPALVLLISVAAFSIIAPRFFGIGALSTILKQVTVTGFIALAQTLIILTAGIDLSVGAILVICTLVMGNLAVFSAVPVLVAVAIGIALGGVMGLANGLLVAKVKLPPFIVTLGTLSIFSALTLWYSRSESIRNVDIVEKAPDLLWFGQGFNVGGASISYGGIALILLAAVLWFILNQTAWGRHVHAIGDDPDAARLSGIRVDRTLISVYAAAGLICGFAAWIAIGRVGSASPIAFSDVNLASITAVVIGGTSLFGGRGSIIGSVLGAFIVGVFNTGLSLGGVDDYWQKFAAGCLVIVAVALDQWLRRASQ